LNIYLVTVPDKMYYLNLDLFNYQVIYTREILKDLCSQIVVNELDNHLAIVLRFSGLKVFKYSFENIKQFTTNEFHNMMKIFLFIIEGIIVKYCKASMKLKEA
jgi:hypothetical protein